MMDYLGLEALYTVHEYQSFDRAAKALHITQSAVSQRIKALEIHWGQPLIIRSQPYRPTELGSQLIAHFKRIFLLEQDLKSRLGAKEELSPISIAINRDSLETWFLELIEEGLFHDVALEIVADDQEITIDYLKSGRVSACLSTSSKAILGGKVDFLGYMDYTLAASPKYAKKHFPEKKSPKECLKEAIAIKFDQKDRLHERYLERFFALSSSDLTFHQIPSVSGFKEFVLAGYGYALLPLIDIQRELERKQLTLIYPKKIWKLPLFWHTWAIQSTIYQKLHSTLIHEARKRLHTKR